MNLSLFVFALPAGFGVQIGTLNRIDLPKPTGSFPIGSESYQLTNKKSADGERVLMVQVWYPCRLSSGHKHVPYLFSPALISAMRKDQYMDLKAPVLEAWRSLQSHAFDRAALAAKPAKFPLLLFSPGFGISRSNYTAFVEELASHGYIVVSIDHPNMGLAVRQDGTALTTTGNKHKGDPNTNVGLMAEDDSFLLDTMLDQEGPLARFAGHIDASRVGAVGHSIGGAAALEAGHDDRRFRACVDLDGAAFGKVDGAGLDGPYLVILNEPAAGHRPPKAMGVERHDDWATRMKKGSGPAFMATVANTTHLTFSDFPFVVPVELLRKQGGTMAPPRSNAIVTRLILAFFEDFLSHSPHAFEREARALPEVKLETFGPKG